VLVSGVRGSARGTVGAVTTRGRVLRLGLLDLPVLPPTSSAPSLSGGAPVRELLPLEAGERVLALVPLERPPDAQPPGPDGEAAAAIPAPPGNGPGVGLALGTASGVVKRVVPDAPANRDSWDVVTLRPGDEVVGAVALEREDAELVFVTSDAQLLRFDAAAVRPQGRAGGGIAGVRLSPGARTVFFGAVDPGAEAVLVTVAGSAGALPGTVPGTAKVTPLAEYPAKGRATGGVRCHRFLRGEDVLQLAWVGPPPPRAAAAGGGAVDLPAATGRRDGSGEPLAQPVDAVGGPPPI
jgi:DNA gyrase subunit A